MRGEVTICSQRPCPYIINSSVQRDPAGRRISNSRRSVHADFAFSSRVTPGREWSIHGGQGYRVPPADLELIGPIPYLLDLVCWAAAGGLRAVGQSEGKWTHPEKPAQAPLDQSASSVGALIDYSSDK
ncbi:hypothetical protein Bbelb_257990 [Branchiostoma belcheri]|nr:hypothetical protein Bbelb_257990 [Branchiostoma belcheri]